MKNLIIIVISLTTLSFAQAQTDWPRWRGPSLNDHSPDTGLLKKWPKEGPEQVWLYKNAGVGYSGPAISDNKLFTMGERKGEIYLIAISTENGKEIWSKRIGKGFKNNWGNGPRGTPTIDEDRAYVLGPNGEVACLKTKDGSSVWSVDLVDQFGGKVPFWGYSESVLIDGKKVLCTPGGKGGAIVALDKLTGKKLWQSENLNDSAQYSSIIPITHEGKSQYVQLFMKTLAGIDANNGQLLWRTDWNGRTAVIPTPIYKDGRIYISSGYGVGCKMIRLGKGGKVEEAVSYTHLTLPTKA